ncbi:MAG: glycosyltransferase family 2 protein [Bacteroidales bacterium]|jgi:glycosyltransferase involved in cell wall biosynthesis|nr:glycosyltransferase family 2 protein [Bacteroidales bacterium]
MGFADFYFKRLPFFEVKIRKPASNRVKFIIVIPCYNEPNIAQTLNSLWECQRPQAAVEVILVINESEMAGEDVKDQNQRTYNEVQDWIDSHSDAALRFFMFYEQHIPSKVAGAGYARKLGMDQALYRFNETGQDNGVILSLDADATVRPDYLVEIEKHFEANPKTNVATIYFEHPLDGNNYSPEIYQAITIYELYLRYYKYAFHYLKFPYSYYTVGSCFAVSAKAYAKQGGMNSKQAGEDFYFLHKIFPLGYSFEINTTCVYPSPRISDRVPFGTGPMIDQIIQSGNTDFITYDFSCFLDLRALLQVVSQLYRSTPEQLNDILYQLPLPVAEFLHANNFLSAIDEINRNCSGLNAFIKRFYVWLNAFKILKYLNATTEKYYPKTELLPEIQRLADQLKMPQPGQKDHKNWLEIFRKMEKKF